MLQITHLMPWSVGITWKGRGQDEQRILEQGGKGKLENDGLSFRVQIPFKTSLK